MSLNTFASGAVVACGVLAVAGLHAPPDAGCSGARHLDLTCASASAGDKKADPPAPTGNWDKKDSELKIAFADGSAKFFLHGDKADKLIVVVCDYTVEKGLVKAKVTGFEGKEEIRKKLAEKLPVGLAFGFKWTAKGDAAKVSDASGDKLPDIFKTHLEGDFEKK